MIENDLYKRHSIHTRSKDRWNEHKEKHKAKLL